MPRTHGAGGIGGARLDSFIQDVLTNGWARRALCRSRVVPRVGAYVGGVYRWAYVVRYLDQVTTLMRRFEARGIEVDWPSFTDSGC